jgi:acetyl esterase/lipase
MSLQNFFINRYLKSRRAASLRLAPEQRLPKGRKFLNRDYGKPWPQNAVHAGLMGGVPVEWVEPKTLTDKASAPICVYFHGGGYIAGSLNSHRDMANTLAHMAQVRMLMVDYRLAPEHPFPAAHEDAMAVYRALLAQGFNPDQMLLGGDSAGGNLALATAQAVRDAGLPSPRGLVLFSPWVDLTHQGESITSNSDSDAMLHRQLLVDALAMYSPTVPPSDSRISPLLGNLANLPPCLTVVSQCEILRDDALQLHQKLQTQGGESTCLQWKCTPHAFPVMARLLPEARDALRQTAGFIAGLLRA